MSARHDGRREHTTLAGNGHTSGFHCGSTALRGLAAHYGWGYSEHSCFGLGGGLDFVYFTPGSTPDRAFFGRPLLLETTFLDRIGVGYDRQSGADWATTCDRLETQRSNGDPVLLATDVAALPYFDTDTHFAPHRVLCVGIADDCDDDRARDRARDCSRDRARDDHDRTRDRVSGGAGDSDRIVLIADNEFDDIKRVPLATLRDAMTDDHLIPIRNRTTIITDPRPEVDPDPPTIIEAAITDTARSMLDSTAALDSTAEAVSAVTGIEGLRTLAADLPQWADRSRPRSTARVAAQNIDTRGTGGGAFRRPYASFLEQATRIVPALSETAPIRLHGIADEWSRLATTFRDASAAETPAELSTHLTVAAQRVQTIADHEERLWKRVLAAIA